MAEDAALMGKMSRDKGSEGEREVAELREAAQQARDLLGAGRNGHDPGADDAWRILDAALARLDALRQTPTDGDK
jgi:hypothetical protein